MQRQLVQVCQLERELVGLYAETCYCGIQAAYGNRSSMERAAQLDDSLHEIQRRLARVYARLRRLDVPPDAVTHLDAGERLALFEAVLCRHDAAFAVGGARRQLLCAMLEDFIDIDTGVH